MKYYTIAILSNNDINLNLNDAIKLDSTYKIIDTFKATKDDEEIVFDYFISDNLDLLKKLGALTDNKKILTNASFQTTIENTFAFGSAINSKYDKDYQLKTIIDTIYEK